MKLRLAVLGLGHETNTFSTVPADLTSYEDGGIHRGAEMIDHYITSQATFAGFLASDEALDVELVPLLAAWINPCGHITAGAFETIVGEMVSSLVEEGPFDGVLLGLHGAAVAEGVLDADGEIAARVRETAGPQVPIGVVVDMHANLGDRLVDAVDVLLPYQTNPHVDARDRGIEVRDRIIEILATGRRPGLALEQLPLVVTITKQDTDEEPMASLLAIARELETREGILDVSIVEGFPYADVPQMGMSIVAAHRGGPHAALLVAQEMASHVWAARHNLQGGGTSVKETLTAVEEHRGEAPLLVLDVGDNVGGGGPGDSTVLFEEAAHRRIGGIVGTLFDPIAVSELLNASINDRVQIAVGGRSGEQDGSPLEVEGIIIGRSDGLYEEPKMAHGGIRFFDAGPTVALRTDDALTIVLTSKLVQPITAHQLTSIGIDPMSFRAIFAKGVNGPRAGYAEVCEGLVVSDTPGVTRLSVEQFTYIHRRQPMYPYENWTQYSPSKTEGAT